MPLIYSLISRGKTVLAEYTDSSGNFPTVTRVLLAKIPLEDGRMSYVYNKYIFHYLVQDGIIYLCMADEEMNRRIPFMFLDDIKGRFLTKYGGKAQTAIAFAMNEEFQHELKLQMEYYNENPDADKVKATQQKLDDVRELMVDNIDKILARGEKFELLVDRTDKLNQQSFGFQRKATRLRRTIWWRNIQMYLFFLILGLIVLYLLISMACGFDFSSCKSSPKKTAFHKSMVWT